MNKTCFVLCPIGKEKTALRERSDSFIKNFIEPVVSDFGYEIVRADKIAKPGEISEQIIKLLLEAELVIADLSTHNPNVFYELAIRHATGKPFIHMLEQGEDIPFDVHDFRTIHFSFHCDHVEQGKQQLKNHVDSIEKDPGQKFKTPIGRSLDISTLKSDDPRDEILKDLQDNVQEILAYLKGFNHPVRFTFPGYPGYSKGLLGTGPGLGYAAELMSLPPSSLERAELLAKVLGLKNCPQCSHPNNADTMICAKCGKELPE